MLIQIVDLSYVLLWAQLTYNIEHIKYNRTEQNRTEHMSIS